MKRLFFSGLVAIGLTGCYQSVNLNDIESAAIICGGLDKIVQIDASFLGQENVVCASRVEIPIYDKTVKLAKERDAKNATDK